MVQEIWNLKVMILNKPFASLHQYMKYTARKIDTVVIRLL